MTHRFRGAPLLILLGTLVIGERALAQSLLDYIRNYDLNDYALGLTISTSQNPYVGSENSVFGYPVLTSFRDSAFTDDWLLLREGDVGIRWVSEESNWEAALIGRFQTLGLGTSDSPKLEGLDDRKWGLEMGPMVGWRGWPVHVNLKTYTEVFGRHDGLISHLLFSLPRESERGYLVPGIELIHQTSDYASYYFGVSPSEATATRPVYQPGDALNTALRVRWGYGITDKWLLYGDLGLEFLDSEITNSPIVGRDKLWSASIAVAYNNNIFQTSESRLGRSEQPSFEIRLAAFSDSIDSNIVRDATDGSDGTVIDLEDLLGLSDQETLLEVDAIFRIGTFHRIEVGYLGTTRNGSATLENDIMFGDALFPAGTTVNSHVDTQITRVAYAFSLINDTQKEVGVMGGLHFSRFKTMISSDATGQSAISNAATPLPVIGLHGSVSLGRKAALGARIQFFRMDFDRYEGSLSYITLDLQRKLGDIFRVGLGYNYYALNLDSRDNDVRGTIEVRHHGPLLYVSAGF
jgi:outer membrane scaffolding protein for murein synthesis (MipA/OmpV family)